MGLRESSGLDDNAIIRNALALYELALSTEQAGGRMICEGSLGAQRVVRIQATESPPRCRSCGLGLSPQDESLCYRCFNNG